MKLTPKLKSWLSLSKSVKADASDDQFKKAAAEALVDGSLSAEAFEKLSKSAEDEEANEFRSLLTGLKTAIADLKSEDTDDDDDDDADDDSLDGVEVEKKSTPVSKKGGFTQLEKMVMSVGLGSRYDDSEDGEKSMNIRVKEAADQYSSTKSAMMYPSQNQKGKAHPLAGQAVKDFSTGRLLDTPSERDTAVAGAFAKFAINQARLKSRTLAFQQMPQHDKELLLYAMENEKWGGASDGGDTADIKDRKLSPREQKALIDDATSGGLEAAPIVFDDMVISAPLLHGELYPLVNTIPLDRGRRIEGVATGNVTGGWGGVDDTAISLFNTASYVSAFDTTIYRWEGAIRIGLDFLSDTPIDFGQHITAQYGERLLEDLDDVIATGNGTTQPEGITVKTGATSVAFGGVAATLGAYESLRFGVPKKEHRQNLLNSIVFVGSETSYQRAKAIPVGASDARRLGGMDYSSYNWMERPYKINESMGNTKIAYVILARYRMYRRRGLTMRTSTEGETLIRNNEMLIVATARYGGQLERGAVCARTSTAQA